MEYQLKIKKATNKFDKGNAGVVLDAFQAGRGRRRWRSRALVKFDIAASVAAGVNRSVFVLEFVVLALRAAVATVGILKL